ncbi:MAG: PilZ domain-containing protein [Acidobacteria bacterium]|nr:PilZ domain-containing protein [Acidobacteriota bacterium]
MTPSPEDLENAHSSKTGRQKERRTLVSDLSLTYEGQSEEVSVRLPDLSPRGMFINTSQYFPMGAVLKISFRLNRHEEVIRARGEVRYCLPGVGIGVEFLDISPDAICAIEKELEQFGNVASFTEP